MMGKSASLPTIWEVPDDLWEQINPVIVEMDPPKATGRKRVDPRRILNGNILRMRTGCHWNRLPKELGDASTIYRAFQSWVALGMLERIWAVLVEECEELAGGAGNGRLRTAPWVKPVLGGFSRPQPHGPG